VTKIYSVALGYNSQVTAASSVALGYGTVCDQESVVAVGTRRIVDVVDGTSSTDAVTLNQLNTGLTQISSERLDF
jgi:trimeric autotransporter adhesin